MNVKSVLFLVCFCYGSIVFSYAQSSQEIGIKQIFQSRAEAIIGFLAGDELEGREAGTRGRRIAVNISFLT